MGLIRKSNKRGGDDGGIFSVKPGQWIKSGFTGTKYKFKELGEYRNGTGYYVMAEDPSDPSKNIKLPGQASKYSLTLFGNSSGGKKMTRKTKKGGKRTFRKTKKGGKRTVRKSRK